MKDVKVIEQGFAQMRAAEYRSQGYEVFLDFPLDFLPRFRADMLVQKDGESKVIAVRTRTSVAASPEIAELAEALSSKPGWSFDLLLVGEPELLEAPQDAKPFSHHDLVERIENAELAFASGLFEASYLLAWSACEAALRILLAGDDFEVSRLTESNYVLGQTAFQDVISEEDESLLSEMLAYRNAIAHGFGVSDFDAERVSELLLAARQLHRASTSSVLSRKDSPTDFNLLNPLDVPARLEVLRSLTGGWLGGQGVALSQEGLNWLSQTFPNLYPITVPSPFTFATPEGRVQMEWSFGATAAILEIDLDARKGGWLSFEDNSDIGIELSFDLNSRDEWIRLAEQVLQTSEASR